MRLLPLLDGSGLSMWRCGQGPPGAARTIDSSDRFGHRCHISPPSPGPFFFLPESCAIFHCHAGVLEVKHLHPSQSAGRSALQELRRHELLQAPLFHREARSGGGRGELGSAVLAVAVGDPDMT